VRWLRAITVTKQWAVIRQRSSVAMRSDETKERSKKERSKNESKKKEKIA
jgi:hypothetical protein